MQQEARRLKARLARALAHLPPKRLKQIDLVRHRRPRKALMPGPGRPAHLIMGRTLNEIARAVGRDPTHISRILRGHKQPSVETLQRLSRYLQLTMDETSKLFVNTRVKTALEPEIVPEESAVPITDEDLDELVDEAEQQAEDRQRQWAETGRDRE